MMSRCAGHGGDQFCKAEKRDVLVVVYGTETGISKPSTDEVAVDCSQARSEAHREVHDDVMHGDRAMSGA